MLQSGDVNYYHAMNRNNDYCCASEKKCTSYWYSYPDLGQDTSYYAMHNIYTHEQAIVFNNNTKTQGVIERAYAQP
jgi:hypothetical protein